MRDISMVTTLHDMHYTGFMFNDYAQQLAILRWMTTVGGPSVEAAVDNASYLEEVATMAYHTLPIDANASAIPKALLDKHFHRKHGAAAYYGQKS